MIDNTIYQDMDEKQLGQELLEACEYGSLEIVKYLLSSSELKKQPNIHYKDIFGWNALMWACANGHLEIVKYLLTNSELKEHSNILEINNDLESVLILSCESAHLEIVNYLLTSPELKKNSNIYHKNKDGEDALMYASYNNNLDIVKYLILEINMKIDDSTLNWLKGNNNKKIIYNDVLKIIDFKALHEILEKDISFKEKKIKI